jgi:hypothetical protein
MGIDSIALFPFVYHVTGLRVARDVDKVVALVVVDFPGQLDADHDQGDVLGEEERLRLVAWVANDAVLEQRVEHSSGSPKVIRGMAVVTVPRAVNQQLRLFQNRVRNRVL